MAENLPPPPKFVHTMPRWQAKVWGAVTIGLGITVFLLITLVGYSIYKTTEIVDGRINADLAFTFSSLAMINTTLLRLLAMLIGAGIIFGGLAISFFSSNDANRVSLQADPAAGGNYKAMVASHAPGVIGIFIGGAIIVTALLSKTTNDYTKPERLTITNFNQSESTPPSQDGQAPGPEMPSAKDAFGGSSKKE